MSRYASRKAVRDSRLGLEVIRSRPILLIPLPLAKKPTRLPTAVVTTVSPDRSVGTGVGTGVATDADAVPTTWV